MQQDRIETPLIWPSAHAHLHFKQCARVMPQRSTTLTEVPFAWPLRPCQEGVPHHDVLLLGLALGQRGRHAGPGLNHAELLRGARGRLHGAQDKTSIR